MGSGRANAWFRLYNDGSTEELPSNESAPWGARCRIGYTRVSGGLVSTVFLGLNHAFSDDAEPVLFETYVEYANDRASGDVEERYATLQAAIEGHKKWVNHACNLVAATFGDPAVEELPGEFYTAVCPAPPPAAPSPEASTKTPRGSRSR